MSGKRFLKLWSTRTLHSTTKPACFRRLRFFQVHTPRLYSQNGWQIWIKHSHKGIIRRSLQRFILASILIINKIVSEGCILSVQSTLVLRTPRYYGHPTIADKRHPPEKRTNNWMKYTPAIADSRYYGNADTFITPSATFHFFFSCYTAP